RCTSAFFKIAQPQGFIEEWSKTYPAASALPLGVIELTLFVLYLVPNTRYLGGLVMLAYLGGAVATHLHAKDGMFFVPVIVGVIAWLGLYLRDRKLRASSPPWPSWPCPPPVTPPSPGGPLSCPRPARLTSASSRMIGSRIRSHGRQSLANPVRISFRANDGENGWL